MPEPTTEREILDAVCEHLELLGAVMLDGIGYKGCAKLVRDGRLQEATTRAHAACVIALGEERVAELGTRVRDCWDVFHYLQFLMWYRRSGEPTELLEATRYLERYGVTYGDLLATLLTQMARSFDYSWYDEPFAELVVEAWRVSKAAVA